MDLLFVCLMLVYGYAVCLLANIVCIVCTVGYYLFSSFVLALQALLARLPFQCLSLGQSIEGQQVQRKGASHAQIAFSGAVVVAFPMIGCVGVPECRCRGKATVVKLTGGFGLCGSKGTEGPAGS